MPFSLNAQKLSFVSGELERRKEKGWNSLKFPLTLAGSLILEVDYNVFLNWQPGSGVACQEKQTKFSQVEVQGEDTKEEGENVTQWEESAFSLFF